MVVSKESFPQVPDATWKPGYLDPTPKDGPPSGSSSQSSECGPLLGGVAHGKNSLVRAALIGPSRNPMFKVELTLPANGHAPEWNSLVGSCGTVSVGDRQDTIQRASIDQLPPWATSTRITVKDNGGENTALGVFGNYRGVVIFVEASRKPDPTGDDATAVSKLFNDQVAKLDAG